MRAATPARNIRSDGAMALNLIEDPMMTAETRLTPPAPLQSTPHAPVQIEWTGGLRFEAGRPDGPRVLIDSDGQTAPGPFDMLLAAVAACAATDVVEIMKKQRAELRALRVRVEADRVSSTPHRLASAVLHFMLEGAGITLEKAARAVELSVTKYCSVRSSLIADAPVTWTIELKP
jgi:putative redox protein